MIQAQYPWHRHAACRDEDPDLFFPETNATLAEAMDICGRCTVTAQCLAQAMAEETGNYRHGIWGGTTTGKRRSLAKPGRTTA